MDLDVVIVNWNSGTYLARLLDSLMSTRTALNRVIVVDNGSSDVSLQAVRPEFGVTCFRLGANRGFAAAANYGISQSKSRFVLLLNPDVEVEPESVIALHDRLQNQPETAIGCPALVGQDGRLQESFQVRPLPGVWSVLSDALFLDELRGVLFRRRPPTLVAGTAEAGLVIEQPAAAFWMLRRIVWEELGGFDESFSPAWFEDVDFCRRLKATRWQIRFFPDLRARHQGAASLDVLTYPDFIRIYYGNLLRYLRKHHPSAYPFLWLPVKAGSWARMALSRR